MSMKRVDLLMEKPKKQKKEKKTKKILQMVLLTLIEIHMKEVVGLMVKDIKEMLWNTN
eukprot:CAMPEP_0176362308 /NCGR_PEP_ID=MMETSP0126-20121128/18340_1 /TAXON_ID=141414 ORGANISM="Strombidinopsis acuminatum, Strain SPMC142" /NCGR_SAMPLE_ID=MMETSP0126 /ASSEMBLY_ACC=CAM_ASM_000229 /LENGTH=57 /DNA_ID=CAMNT_0017718179 /DNA_START=744 /DNA_END=917 /DNA_ORIENTATION=-